MQAFLRTDLTLGTVTVGSSILDSQGRQAHRVSAAEPTVGVSGEEGEVSEEEGDVEVR